MVVLLEDPRAAVPFISSSFLLTGDTAVPERDTIHSLAVDAMQRLPGPGSCRHYSEPGSYGACYEKEVAGRFGALLNCSPPWFRAPALQPCALSPDTALPLSVMEKVSNIFFELFAGTLSPPCLPPCTTLSPSTQFVRSEPAANLSRLYLNFPRRVRLTKEKEDVDALFFITRLFSNWTVEQNCFCCIYCEMRPPDDLMSAGSAARSDSCATCSGLLSSPRQPVHQPAADWSVGYRTTKLVNAKVYVDIIFAMCVFS